MNDILGEEIGYWVISGFLTLLGLFGVVLAANAVDQAIMVFGLSLTAFSILFCFFAIHRAYALSSESHD